MLQQFIGVPQEQGLAIAHAAIVQTALEKHQTVEQVRADIQEVIVAGWNNPDPAIHKRWLQVPRKGKLPTPEEFLWWLIKQQAN